MPATVKVALEQGRRRTFASALDWPGWARAGRGDDQALEALESYRNRYGALLTKRGLATPTGQLVVAATVHGDAGTDFGVPGQVVDLDHRRLTSSERARLASILVALWEAFDDATSRRVVLRHGPRGGGRTFEQLARHVTDAEVAYARGLGLTVRATDGDGAAARALRKEFCELVLGTRTADRDARWPIRYGVRRIAWHVVDHLFELEDRSST